MGSKPRVAQYVAKLVVEKQRAVYWLCVLLEDDSAEARARARRALAELGYDAPRIEALLLLGEPTAGRAGEPGIVWLPRARATAARASEQIAEPWALTLGRGRPAWPSEPPIPLVPRA